MTATGLATAVTVDGLTIAAAAGPPLLRGGSLALRPGRITAITGASGAGKTTLMLAVLGFVARGATRTSGTVNVLGHDPLSMDVESLRRLRRDHLAFVGQDPGSALNPTMKVRTLLSEVSASADRGAPAEALARVRLPESFLHRRPGELSGGQQRRVALARALVRDVDVLLIDEPLAGLDGPVRREVAAMLRDLADTSGVAIAVSGHHTEELFALADDATHVEIPHPVSGGLPTSRPKPGTLEPRVPDGSVTLSAESISVSAGSQTILERVDLSAHRGIATAVVGASGAGKTTLARVLVGLEPEATGTLRLGSEDLALTNGKRARRGRSRIQLVPQNPLSTLNPRRTIGATLARPLRLRGVTPRSHRSAAVADLLASVGLPSEFADRHPGDLSGGQRQRVAIARALAAEPDLMICDEITSAVDADTAESIMDLLHAAVRERGLSLLVITHDMDLVRRHCGWVYVLAEGRVVESGAVTDVFTSPQSHHTLDLLG